MGYSFFGTEVTVTDCRFELKLKAVLFRFYIFHYSCKTSISTNPSVRKLTFHFKCCQLFKRIIIISQLVSTSVHSANCIMIYRCWAFGFPSLLDSSKSRRQKGILMAANIIMTAIMMTSYSLKTHCCSL